VCELGEQLLFSVSSTAYYYVVQWRNADTWSCERKIVTEFAFLPIAVIGAIEGVVRGAFGFLTIPCAFVFGNGVNQYSDTHDNRNWADRALQATVIASIYCFEAYLLSTSGLIINPFEHALPERGSAARPCIGEFLPCLL
jgi:hypothetical protein